MRVYLSLGSNLGNREKNFQRALQHLKKIFTGLTVSGSHVGLAVGRDGKEDHAAPPFLNAVAQGDCALAPQELLKELEAIEVKMGRDPREKGKFKPRIIDLDIIHLEEGGKPVIVNDPNLVVPHPRWQDRDFVKLPLKELGFNPAKIPKPRS